MRATMMYAAGDVRVENVPDPTIVEPTDAIVRVTLACICGSDLWPYRAMEPSDAGQSMGHEGVGVVEAVGRDVGNVRAGDVVIDAVAIARPGGAIGRVGVPHYAGVAAVPTFYKNVTVGGGPAPARTYIDELLPDVLEGRIAPGRVFDRIIGLERVPDGYVAMDRRESIKVMIDL